MLLKVSALVVASLVFTACGIEEGSSSSDSYSNHVKLECNDQVLVDRTFTSESECTSFRDANTFSCGGIELPISC